MYRYILYVEILIGVLKGYLGIRVWNAEPIEKQKDNDMETSWFMGVYAGFPKLGVPFGGSL